jgi:hypothetical protein
MSRSIIIRLLSLPPFAAFVPVHQFATFPCLALGLIARAHIVPATSTPGALYWRVSYRILFAHFREQCHGIGVTAP